MRQINVAAIVLPAENRVWAFLGMRQTLVHVINFKVDAASPNVSRQTTDFTYVPAVRAAPPSASVPAAHES